MRIIIGADVIPKPRNLDKFIQGNMDEVIDVKLLNQWLEADYRVFNLETPMIDEESPIQKHGSNFRVPTETINGIKALKPDLICLSNNHIKDQGVKGIESTIETLDRENVSWTGIMESNQGEHPYHILKKDGKKVGIYNCAENEFSIASRDEIGAVPFDPLVSLDVIASMKEVCDIVIVLYHGGIEYYRYPSPLLQKSCRRMIDKGADLIICQHSHCVGSMEVYKDKTIIYGQGNFLFDIDNIDENEFFSNGMLVEVQIIDSTKFDVGFIPIRVKEHQVLKAKDHDDIISGFIKRSKAIEDDDFIYSQYTKLANQKLDFYLREFSARGKWIDRLDKYLFKGYLLNRMYNRSKLTQMANYVECEAHREVIIKGLQDRKGMMNE